MNSLFNTESQQTVITRLNNLSETSQPTWGKMTITQMLSHCQKPLEVANGNLKLDTKIGFAKKLVLKLFKPLMYNDKPWKRNLGTVKEFKIADTERSEEHTSELQSRPHLVCR